MHKSTKRQHKAARHGTESGTKMSHAVIRAIEDKDHATLALLLQRPTFEELNKSPTNDYRTPLVCAVCVRNKVAIEMLIDAGARPNYAGCFSPLSEAVLRRDEEIARLLMRRGSDAGAALVLILCLKSDDEEAVQFLLRLGVDPCGRSATGKTYLELASLFASRSIQGLLRAAAQAQARHDSMARRAAGQRMM